MNFTFVPSPRGGEGWVRGPGNTEAILESFLSASKATIHDSGPMAIMRDILDHVLRAEPRLRPHLAKTTLRFSWLP